MVSVRTPFLVLILCTTSSCTVAEEATMSASEMSAQARTAQLELDNLIRVTRTLHEKFTALAAEMPGDDLTWRPMDDVRSASEVFIHVAADNWFVPALMGWEAPPETEVTDDVQTFRTYQDREMSREDMLEVLDASFEFFLGAMEESAGELDRVVVLGTPTTVGDVWIRAVVHLHEHLGQSIAYARTNDVVPPWSR